MMRFGTAAATVVWILALVGVSGCATGNQSAGEESATSGRAEGETEGAGGESAESSGESEPAEPKSWEDLPNTSFTYDESLDPGDRDFPEVPKEDVEEAQYAPDAGNLPQGVVYAKGGVDVESGYPNPERPHVYLGRVVYDGDSEDRPFTHKILGMFRREVGRRGANLIVWEMNEDSSEPAQAYAVRVSDAEVKDFETDPEKLLADEAKKPKAEGYRDVVADETRSLGAFEPIEMEARRGRCYWVTFALKPGAKFNDHAREMLYFEYDHPSEVVDNSGGQPEIEETGSDGELTAAARSGHARIPCPWKSGALQIRLMTVRGETGDRKKVAEVGEGEVEVRVYARDISERELEKRIEEHEKAKQKAIERRNRRRRKQCQECESVKRKKCGGDPTSCPEYLNCLGGEYFEFCESHGY